MPDVTVCIPWRPSPSRLKPYECVRRWWAEHFPDWPVITADSDTEIFSLSQARNNAVRQAKTDVVALCDADTVPPADSVRAAVAEPVGITWPHESWRLIPAEYARRPWSEFPSAPALVDYPDGLGGCMVAATEEYWRLGGHPEEFSGWGHEDRAFHMIVTALSTFRRIGGTAFSIEHNVKLRQADSPGWDRDSRRNRQLVLPYENAAGHPELMEELLRIRGEARPSGPQDWRVRAGVHETDPVRRALFRPATSQVPVRRPDWRARERRPPI